MSLINDVLRDLEARRADDLKRQNLQGEIRPLPPLAPPAPRWRLALAATVVLTIVGGGAGWWYYGGPANPAVQTPAPAKAPAVPSAPVVAEAAPSPQPLIAAEKYELQPALSLSAPPEAPPAPVTVAPKAPAPASATAAAPAVPPPANPPVVTKALTAPAELPKASPPPEKPRAAPVEADKGRIEMKAVLATPRDRADAEYRSAQAHGAAGRTNESVEALRLALKHDPAYGAARQALVKQLLELRRIDDASAVLAEGLELQPAQVGWAMSLARLQVERGDLGAAQRTLSRSAAHAGGNADYAGFYGHVQYRLGHHRDAIALYQSAARLAPADGRWWFGLGVALEGDGRGGEAKDAYRRALATGTLNADLSALAEQKLR